MIDETKQPASGRVAANPNILQLRVSVLRAQKRDAELEPLLAQESPLVRRRAKCWPMSGAWLTNRITGPFRKAYYGANSARIGPERETTSRSGACTLPGGRRAILPPHRCRSKPFIRRNPLISGVIRATVDYYWRHDKPRAICARRFGRARSSLAEEGLSGRNGT